jgi:hypothetical protein
MVKFICIEVDHLEIPAMVVTVAFNAIVCPCFSRAVIAFPVFYQRSNFKMAIQAFIIGDLLPQEVALGAV